MDYLVDMLTRSESISPLARQTGERNHPNPSNDLISSGNNNKKHQAARKVKANIDDRFKAVSDHRRRATTTNTSRIDPWISNYVLVFLKSRSTITTYHPKEAPMIEILNRGGPFWDYNKHIMDTNNNNNDGPKELEGWLLVSDGLHSIKIWLTQQCRDEIWQQVTTSMANPMYAFHNYSARQCGLLEKFRVKPIRVEVGPSGHHHHHHSSSCELLCDSFRCQPQMQYMVVSDPNKIQNVNDYVEVKHAYQAYCKFYTSGVQLGDVKKVVDNPDLCASILRQAEQRQQQQQEEEENERAKQNGSGMVSTSPAAAAVHNPSNINGDGKNDEEDDDDDGLPSMNIRDMLASPTEEEEKDQQPSSSPHPPLQPAAKRDLTQALRGTIENNQKSNEKDYDDDETDFMGSLPNSAILALNSQQSLPQPSVVMEAEKETEIPSPKDGDGDDDSVIEVEPKRSPVMLRSSPRKRISTTSSRPRRNPRHKRIKFRKQADWPNLPAFTALCKQLSDPTRKIIDIPEIQQPRVSLKAGGLGKWLDKLGY